MIRVFFKYSAIALMVQMIVCIPYYLTAMAWLPSGWEEIIREIGIYFYLPVCWLVVVVLEPINGGGDTCFAAMLMLGPGVGVIIYSVIFGVAVCFTKHFREKWRKSHAA